MELNSNDTYQVFISGYRLANVSHGKPYYVYAVEMVNSNDGTRYLIEKRYSEFNNLHRMLKKNCHTAPFPPKRVRNSNSKVLEHRRAALEIYMQKMLRLANTKQQVLSFLGMDGTNPESFNTRIQTIYKNSSDTQPSSLQHHPVLTFQCDPYIYANITSSLPDVVTNGVLSVQKRGQLNEDAEMKKFADSSYDHTRNFLGKHFITSAISKRSLNRGFTIL